MCLRATLPFMAALLLQVLFLPVFSTAAGPEHSPIVREIQINLPPGWATPERYRALARDIIFIKPGDRFHPERLEASLNALRISRKFGHIAVDEVAVNDDMILVFDLTPFQYIRAIRIRGTYPLFEREVLSAMTIYTGDAFLAREIPQQQKAVAALYRQEGFIDPQVDIQYTADPSNGDVDVLVNIDKGPYYTLQALTILGNTRFSDNRLKMRMVSWRNKFLPGQPGRFTQNLLTEDLQSLLQLYRRHDFAEAAVTHELITDSESHRIEVVIQIEEGPQYAIRFEGNTALSDRKLKKELAPLQEGNPHDAHLRRIRRNLLARYAEAGFTEVRVNWQSEELTENGQPRRQVVFEIEEGPQTIIQAVTFTGNQALDQDTLERNMLSRPPSLLHKGAFVPAVLEEDRLAIQTRYLQMGYTQVEITEELAWSEDRREISIHLHIDEALQTRVRQVEIRGLADQEATAALALLELQPGVPYRHYMLQHDQNVLSNQIAEQGYPHVRVTRQVTYNDDRSAADIVFEVQRGPFVRMGQVYFDGNLRTRTALLQDALTITPDEPFSMRRLLESQHNIRSLEVFNAVQFKTIGLKEQADTITLLADLEERKPYYVSTGLGYETHKGFYANARVGDLNLWGRNKQAWLSGELSEIGYRSDAGLLDPKFLGTKFAANLALYIEERQEFNQNFGVRSYGISGGFTRPLKETMQAGFNLRLERRSQFQTSDTAWRLQRRMADEDLLATRTIFVGTPFIRYDSRDSYIRPRRGMLASLAVDISKGLDNDMDDFFKYQVDWRYYVSPLPRLTLACMARAGLLEPYGSSDQVPDDQLFFLGGTTNVRGFKENMLRFDPDNVPLGGRTSLLGSLEARWEVFSSFELATFVDFGRLAEIPDVSGDPGWRTSVGVGLRYITAIGPLGLLYGHKLDPGPGESRGRIHFSVGYTF